MLDAAIRVLDALADFSTDPIQEALKAVLVEEMGIKPRFAFTPLRVAVTGRRVSPPLFESMEILGKESALARVAALRATL
ncbi:Glutamate--tRNA ligase [compost metagenome]